MIARLDGFEALRRTVTGYHDQLADIINMELIVERIRIERPEIPNVCVEQTGGGCATVYVGECYAIDRAGRVLNVNMFFDDPRIHDVCKPVLAGPGWFSGPHWTDGRAHRDEFSIGYDMSDPDPDVQEGPCYSDWRSDPVTERDMARLMVRLYDQHPRRVRKEIP